MIRNTNFQNILNIDIQQIASIKNRKNQRNKTKVNNTDYFSKESVGKIRFNKFRDQVLVSFSPHLKET